MWYVVEFGLSFVSCEDLGLLVGISVFCAKQKQGFAQRALWLLGWDLKESVGDSWESGLKAMRKQDLARSTLERRQSTSNKHFTKLAQIESTGPFLGEQPGCLECPRFISECLTLLSFQDPSVFVCLDSCMFDI